MERIQFCANEEIQDNYKKNIKFYVFKEFGI